MTTTNPQSDSVPNQGYINIDGDGAEPRQGVVQLDSGVDRRAVLVEIAKNFPLLVAGTGYMLHLLYRRCIPRKLPRWTTLQLGEIYLMIGVGQNLSVRDNVWKTKDRLYKDDDWAALAVAPIVAEASTEKKHLKELAEMVNQDQSLKAFFDGIYRVGYNGTITEKLKWWNQHLPHDRVVWDGWAATLVYNKFKAGEDIHRPQCAIDVDACATYLAKRTSPRLVNWSNVAGCALGLSVPFALRARRMGRRALYLPMNGVQRLIFYAWVYVETFVWLGQWEYLERIEDRHGMAMLLRRIFQGIDKEVTEMRQAFAPFRAL
ncbi:hypothetical protein C8Q74DRAFT_1371400 [Fomes fomentarius]|nr:hypothetical protein C8Q74DRAFT_1371400 [Fomes fomentarius]